MLNRLVMCKNMVIFFQIERFTSNIDLDEFCTVCQAWTGIIWKITEQKWLKSKQVIGGSKLCEMEKISVLGGGEG